MKNIQTQLRRRSIILRISKMMMAPGENTYQVSKILIQLHSLYTSTKVFCNNKPERKKEYLFSKVKENIKDIMRIKK